ncbi:hypothetical protein OIU79_007177 [Salix purpurea]|uniref:Uncharacterized protein n=1 Tax=Salix purpurea TaxID=77065 RepID=A0A9Q0TXB0_SALPP|nr:hypothetical protein OIU79_007177 [Salix purpurea]
MHPLALSLPKQSAAQLCFLAGGLKVNHPSQWLPVMVGYKFPPQFEQNYIITKKQHRTARERKNGIYILRR